jgi:hypothetical protein
MGYNLHPPNPHSALPFLLVVLLLVGCESAFQTVNWAHITDIKSGDHKLLLQPLTVSPYTYTQINSFNYSAAPNVILALRSLAIDATNLTIDFTISVGSVSSTQFTTTVVAPGVLPITLLYYMYITVSKTYSYTYFLYYSFDLSAQLNNSLTLSTSVAKSLNATIAQYASAQVMPYFISFSIGANSTEYSIATSGAMTNSSSFAIQINSNSSLSRVELMVIIVDKYAY